MALYHPKEEKKFLLKVAAAAAANRQVGIWKAPLPLGTAELKMTCRWKVKLGQVGVGSNIA